MGWSVEWSPRPKAEFIADRVREQTAHFKDGTKGRWVVTHHALRGSHLWKVVEVRTEAGELRDHFIALDLISRKSRKGDDPTTRGCWGYKDECESVGPDACDCPLYFLDMVPPDDRYGWRDRVRAWHKAQGERRRAIKPGQRWRVKANQQGINEVVVHGHATKRGQWLVGCERGYRYTVPAVMLLELVPAAPPPPEPAPPQQASFELSA